MRRRLWARWIATPRIVRFLMVGGINTVFGYTAYATLLLAGLHFAGAALLATIAGIAFNYVTTGRLVFGKAQSGGPARFVAVYGVVYLINVAGLALLIDAGLDPYRAGLVLILPTALCSYVLMKRFVFRDPHAVR